MTGGTYRAAQVGVLGWVAVLAPLPTACVNYTERVSGPPMPYERLVGPPFAAATSADPAQNRLVLQLRNGNCQTLDEVQITETTYRKPSPGGAWTLVGIGVAVAGLGTLARFTRSNNDPSSCLMLNNSCASDSDLKTIGAVLWGVGGLTAGSGLSVCYNRLRRSDRPASTLRFCLRPFPFMSALESRLRAFPLRWNMAGIG